MAVLVQTWDSLKQSKLDPELVRIVMGCLEKDPDERFTAARVVASLTKFIHQMGVVN